MIQENFEVIVSKIAAQSSLPRVEVEHRIQKKLTELQDLISREGAAHIVANELNVNLFSGGSPGVSAGPIKVAKLAEGMNMVGLTARIVSVYEVRSYNSKGRQGRVASFSMGDETGTTRLVIWDENLISDAQKLKEGDIVKVRNGYVKQNNMGYKEVHLGNKAQLEINPANESVGEVKKGGASTRKSVKDVQAGDAVELYGTVVQVFEPKFYDACPVCNKKVFPQDNGTACPTHGVVAAVKTPIMNVYLDDSTGVLRAVFFRDQARQLLGENENNFDAVKGALLGKQMMIRGRVTKNEMFNRFEIVVAEMEDANPEKLLAELNTR